VRKVPRRRETQCDAFRSKAGWASSLRHSKLVDYNTRSSEKGTLWSLKGILKRSKCYIYIYISYKYIYNILYFNSAEPINIGRRRVGRPRQQWLFRSNEIIHNRISHTDYDGDPFQNNNILQAARQRVVWDHAKHRSIRMSCDCLRLNAWQWQEKKTSIIVYIIIHNIFFRLEEVL